jgi:hypothetical protein
MEIVAKLKEFEKQRKKDLEEVIKLHAEFLKRYPFRERAEEIENLTPEKIYNPGMSDYFLWWIEFKLKDLGHISVGSASYAEAARENSEKFKELLKVSVDDSLNIAEKIDAHWEGIKWFGGDKLIAKKIIYCYNPEKMLPIFKTEHLEHFARQLGADYTRDAYNSYGKSYNMISAGQKCELINNILIRALGYQDSDLSIYETLLLARFLYETFPPQKRPLPGKREGIGPLHSLGALFEPSCEQEIVYLFSVLHRDLGFPYVLKMRTEFPDAVVIDKDRETKTIEFEVNATDFIVHGHPKEGCDFIVCWENDLEELDEDMPEIISLKEFIFR